jgi:UPF0755 protein
MLWRRKREGDAPGDRPGDRVPEAETRALDIRGPSPDRRPIMPKSPRAALQPERVRPPPRRSAAARHPMVVAGSAILTIITVIALLAVAGVLVGKQQMQAAGPLPEDKIVNVPRSGVREVADALERERVIEQPWLFIAAVLVQKSRGDLKSGEYQFTKQASLQDVINTIIEGKVVQHPITIPEGLTSEQIVQRLLQTDVLSGNIREIPREGTLLPETYRVTRGYPREQIIQRMQQSQRQLLQEVWNRRSPDLPVRTPEELLTLASIVEKETGRPEERARVAAVFVNRLKQRMKLQSDPTIIYGLVGGKGTLGRPIMRSEITQPTPYNTYTIDGLPPGPIANPGRASLEATAAPARTREIFFVADGSGGHAFSETLSQHQQNVAKLRALERQENDSSAGAMSAEPPAAQPDPAAAQRPRAQQARPAANPSRPATLAPPPPTTQPAQQSGQPTMTMPRLNQPRQ